MSERDRFNSELMLLFVSVRVQSLAENLMNYFQVEQANVSRFLVVEKRDIKRHCRRKSKDGMKIYAILKRSQFCCLKATLKRLSSSEKAD